MNAPHGNFPPTTRRQGGLSLIELMVAMVIALFLIAGVIHLFLGSKQTYRFHEALSRLQENGRFAMESLARDARMAGFTGCPPNNPIANVLNNSANWWADFGSSRVRGYAGNEAFPGQGFGVNPGERVAATDALTVLRGGDGNYSIVDHVVTSAQFKLNQLHDLQSGSIVMVCDGQQTSILQLTNVNSANVTIVHNTGTGTPGNCTKGLGSPVVCTANGTPHQYGPDSTMVDFKPGAFFIGVSQSGNTRSLYQFRLQVTGGTTAAMVAQELIEGVQDLRILYGEDTSNPPNRRTDQYVTADAVSNWNNVVSVRIHLLLASVQDNIVQTPMTVVFPPDTGNNFTAGDRRLYQAFSATVGIRNRLP